MGSNRARNLAHHGNTVALFNRHYSRTEKLMNEHGTEGNFVPAETLKEFAASLKRPRTAIIMVKAGAPTDATIEQLEKVFEPGDIIVDGGNYFFKDNMSAGVRFGYTNINGTLDTGNFNLGEQNDVNLAFKNLHLQSSALSVGLYFRSYAGLDSKGHFGLFGEVDLSMKTGNSEFTYETEGTLRSTFSDDLKLSLGFNPGLAVYIFPNVCSTVSFGLGGIEYTKIKQKDANGNEIGQRTASKMRFRLNLLNIRIGVTVHLWNKKANKA